MQPHFTGEEKRSEKGEVKREELKERMGMERAG